MRKPSWRSGERPPDSPVGRLGLDADSIAHALLTICSRKLPQHPCNMVPGRTTRRPATPGEGANSIMTKQRNFRHGILASIALIALAGTCLGACVGAPESGDDESSGEQVSRAEPVGEAEQAVAEGGACGKLAGPYCDPGLVCCSVPPNIFAGTCRDLQTDEYNCGSCGHVCPINPWTGVRACVNGGCI